MNNLLLIFKENLIEIFCSYNSQYFTFLIPNIQNISDILTSNGQVIKKYLHSMKLDRLWLIYFVLNLLLIKIFIDNDKHKIWIQGCLFAFYFYNFFLFILKSWNFQGHLKFDFQKNNLLSGFIYWVQFSPN